MAADEESAPVEHRDVRLREFIVVIGGEQHDPGLVNPGFLEYNGIIEPPDRIERPVILEPGFANLRCSNGVTIIAEETTVGFYQDGFDLSEGDIVSPRMVERYLDASASVVTYEFVNIAMRGVRWYLPSERPAVGSGYLERSVGVSIQGCNPEGECSLVV